MPLLASNSSKRELPIRIVNHHEDAITPRGIAGKHVLEIQNPAEPIHRVGLRWLVLPPRERGVVERKVIPLEVAGVVVEDMAYLLDGGDGREHELLAGGGVKEMELGAGVRGDEPAMG